MNFIFRVDSSVEIGHGHLMRCLVLAKELSKLNVNISFICRDHEGSAHQLILDSGFELHLLPGKSIDIPSNDYNDWLGSSQKADVEQCNQIMSGLNVDHIIVDHYSIDIEWESRAICQNLTIIDDLANRKHVCRFLIDQSLVNTKSSYNPLIKDNYTYIGNENIILRDEFRSCDNWYNSHQNSVFICMGGSDPKNKTTQIVRSLKNNTDLIGKIGTINVVAGSSFTSRDELLKEIVDSPIDIAIQTNSQEISKQMTDSHFSIVSCGTMVLESCSLGVPTIGIVLADNQAPTAEYLCNKQAIYSVAIDANVDESLGHIVSSLLSNNRLLDNLSNNALLCVNKYAVKNIAEILIHA